MSDQNNELQLEVQDAIGMLNQALVLPSPQLITIVGHAERKVVQVRDALIERGRHEASDPLLAPALQHVNLALSLLAALEYPTSLERKYLDEACQVLSAVFSGEPPQVKAEPPGAEKQPPEQQPAAVESKTAPMSARVHEEVVAEGPRFGGLGGLGGLEGGVS